MKKLIILTVILFIAFSCKKELLQEKQKVKVNSIELYETNSDGITSKLITVGSKPIILDANPSDEFTIVIPLSQLKVKITNIQDTATQFLVKIPSDSEYILYNDVIQPDSSLIIDFSTCGEFRVKPLNDECGIVGLNTCLSILGSKVEYLKYKQDDVHAHIVWKLLNVPDKSKHSLRVNTNVGVIDRDISALTDPDAESSIDITF